MSSRTFPVALVLTVTLLTILPSSYTGFNRVQGLHQTTPLTSLPFGPQVDRIVFEYYSDFSTMFNAFTKGGPNGIDITDWPVFASDSGITAPGGTFCDPSVHPDFYCSSTGVNFGLFQLDINHDRPFLGVNQLTPRTTSPVHAVLTPGPAGCSTGFGSVNVQLHNQETNAVDQLFAVNNLTLTQVLSGGVLSGSTTLTGTGGTGRYSFPCVVAGTYLLSNSGYANCANANLAPCEIVLGSGTTLAADFFSNWNSPSTQQYTQAGVYIRQAIRHLLDKPKFILSSTLQGQVQCTDVYAALPQGFQNGYCSIVNGVGNPLPADVLNAECPSLIASETTQGIPAAQQVSCNPIDAYLLNSTAMGASSVWWGQTGRSVLSDNGYPSEQDIRAACDLFVLAGFPVTPSGNTCIDVAGAAQGTTSRAAYPHNNLPSGQQIIILMRTHPPRRAFGQINADSLNFIFGTANNGAASGNTVCAVNYGFQSPAPGCIPSTLPLNDYCTPFCDGLNAQTWNLYTGRENFGINPDNEYYAFNSAFASNYCGGTQATLISDYDIVCDPKLDAYTSAGEFADTFNHSVNIFQNASYVSTEGVSVNPVYNLLQRFVALDALNFGSRVPEASLVNGLGTGWAAGTTGGFSTLLNAHCDPGFVPVNSSFACGGGNPNILRRGQSQDSDTFSPYQATSPWDFDVINMIWDSMLHLNPNTGGPNLQLSNWMVRTHTSSFNPSEASCSIGQGCVSGTTTQLWYLRPDLHFHDGTAVTAGDVCFSILSYRDMPAALLQPSVVNVATCTALNQSTVQVKLTLSGPFYDNEIGLLPVLPHHAWAAACNWPVGAPEPASAVLQSSQCANPADDPMVPLSGSSTNRMIGSGPYECLGVPSTPSPGAVGFSCSQTAGGSPGTSMNTLDGKLFLTAFHQYHRGPVALQGTKYQRFSWADKFDTGLVIIVDLADAALHFKHYDPYWASPIFSNSPATCSATGGPGTGNLQCVDIGDIATIALYKGIGATDPIPLGSYVSLDPHIDRFGTGLSVSSGGGYYLAASAKNIASGLEVNTTFTGLAPLSMTLTGTVITSNGSANVTGTATLIVNSNGRTIWRTDLSVPGTVFGGRLDFNPIWDISQPYNNLHIDYEIMF